MLQPEIIPLYPTPLYNCLIDLDDQEVSYIKGLEIDHRPNGYISKSKHVVTADNTPTIYQQVMAHLYNFVDAVGFNFDLQMITSWINLHERGNSSRRHIHANSIIGGVLFLDTPPNTGEFLLFNPEVNGNRLFSSHIECPKHKITEYNAEYRSIKPTTGQLLLFPSYLAHTVTENKCDDLRWTIGFSFFALGTLRQGNLGEITFHASNS